MPRGLYKKPVEFAGLFERLKATGLSQMEVENRIGMPKGWLKKARAGIYSNRAPLARALERFLVDWEAKHPRKGAKKGSRGSAPALPAASSPVPEPPGLSEAVKGLTETLRTSQDPLEITRASMRLAAARYAEEIAKGDPSPRAAEDLKKASQELRNAETGFLELAKSRGELIERDVAKACMGQLAQEFVRALERLEMRVAAQLDSWLGDPEMRDLDTEARGKIVREWLGTQTRAARLEESQAGKAAELERMLRAEIEDRA